MKTLTTTLVAVTLLSLAPMYAFGQRKLRISPETSKPLLNDLEASELPHHPVSRFVDGDTIAVMELSLKDLSTESLASQIGQLGRQELWNAADTEFENTLDRLSKANARHVIVVFSKRSIEDGLPLFVIPSEQPTKAGRAIVDFLATLSPIPVESDVINDRAGNQCSVIATRPALQRISEDKGLQRDDLVRPLVSENRLPNVVVFSLPSDALVDLAFFWPDAFPSDWMIAGSPRQLARDTRTVVLDLEVSPAMRAELTVLASSAEASARTLRFMQVLVSSLNLPEPMPTVTSANRLVVAQVTGKSFPRMIDRIARPLQRQVSDQRTSNALNKMGLALHNFHSAYKHMP
ncbi:MAG: hypothetical protein AAGA03_13380, partial [Planctomycetota bacterium]